MTKLRITALFSTVLLVLALAVGCSDDETGTGSNAGTNSGTNSGTNAGTNAGTDGGAGLDGGPNATTNSGNADAGPSVDANSPFEVNDAGQVSCGDRPCACDNGIDDDGDGLIDGLDPECTGPYDDDEGTFATGIPGDNQDPIWQDCFFDGNSGSGDDKCRYKTGCLTGDLPEDDRDCQVGEQCEEFCRPLTPNGCDCFGCCEVFRDDGTSTNILIGGDCSTAEIDNPDVCTQCVQAEACVNTCGRCELCLGKTIDDLPADCFDDPGDDAGTTDGGTSTDDMGGGGGGGATCDDGEQVCQLNSECPSGYYCQLGCCLPIIL